MEQEHEQFQMTEEQKRYDRARKQVIEIKGFYTHLLTYISVMIFLFMLNMFTSSHTYWFIWPALGWGIGIIAHANSVFVFKGFFGHDWEEKKIKQLMDKDK